MTASEIINKYIAFFEKRVQVHLFVHLRGEIDTPPQRLGSLNYIRHSVIQIPKIKY